MSEFYLPKCIVENCKGILLIDFDLDNFTVFFQCDKNKNHFKNNIDFSLFEKYYLKKVEIIRCASCFKIIDNQNYIYVCHQYIKSYCNICYTKFMKYNKCKNKLNIINFNICNDHKKVENLYCNNCNKSICNVCQNKY